MKAFYILPFVCLLAGCSLWPKKVEFLQDKVEKVPEATVTHKEVQKEAAEYVSRKTKETVIAAVKENSSTNVLKPAVEAEVVADSLAGSMGKPEEPWRKEAQALAAKLDKLDAKLDLRLEEFREGNNKNEGRKIEGSGLLSIGYFTQFIVLAFILCLAWVAIKIVGLFNPAVSVGSQVLSGGLRGVSKIVSSGFGQIISAGEVFKDRIEQEIEDPYVRDKILDLFKRSHMEKQSPEVQDVIKKLTSPDIKG